LCFVVRRFEQATNILLLLLRLLLYYLAVFILVGSLAEGGS